MKKKDFQREGGKEGGTKEIFQRGQKKKKKRERERNEKTKE